MAFRSATKSRVYLAGFGLHAYLRTAGESAMVDMHDITVLDDTAKEFLPGLSTGTFTASGPLDASNAAVATLDLAKALGTTAMLTWAPVGDDGAVQLFTAYSVDITKQSSVTGTIDWSMQAQVADDLDINGVVLENNTTVTVDTDGTAVDNGAATSNGAVFHCHVTAYSGLTNDIITIEGSATGSFTGEETTVATFSTFSGTGGNRQEVTGTVPRYLRVVDNVTGTGSITRFVAAARR